jgi:hypothetical protein
VKDLKEIEECINLVKDELKEVNVRLHSVELEQKFFEKSIIEQSSRIEQENKQTTKLIESVQTDVQKLPDKVSNSIVRVRSELEHHVASIYATKVDVITPGALRNILLLVVTVGAIVLASVNWVLDHDNLYLTTKPTSMSEKIELGIKK